jgi:hypothetical protein
MRFWLVLGVLASATAYADDAKTADEKFEQASKLRDAGKTTEACALFDESLHLNPNAIGTILNVARCAEESGKVATAIRYFSDARDRAREQSLTPQLTAAEDHLAKLIPRESHLAITFAETYPAEAKLVVGGRVVDFSAASDIVVDPGQTQVVVSAPGRVPFSTNVEVAEAQHQSVAVPKLRYPVTLCASCRAIGQAGVAAGGVAFAFAVVYGGFYSHHEWNQADKTKCTGSGDTMVCPPDTVDAINKARSAGDIGTAIGVAGIALTLGGLALWYFSPPSQQTKEHMAIVPMVSPTEAGLAAITRF